MERIASHRVRGSLLVLLGAVSWGFSGTCGQFLSQNHGIDPMWISSVRMSFGAVILAVICLITRREQLFALCRDKKSWLQLVIYALFGVIACQLCYLEAIAYTNSGIGTMMEQLCLILIMGFACLHARRLPRPKELLSLLAALAGVFCICTQGDVSALHIPPKGLLWGGLAALSCALYMLLPVGLLSRWGSLEVTTVSMVLGALFSLVLFRPWQIEVVVDAGVLGASAGMVVMGTVVAYLAFLQGVKDAGPVIASLLNSTELVAAFMFSALWLGTEASIYDMAGLAFILVMVVLITLDGREQDAKKLGEDGEEAQAP